MASEHSKIFGIRIKSIREAKHCTQAEMAEELNCSQQTINVWENGWHTPKISMLVKVADTYNVTVDWLLGRKEEIRIVAQTPQEYQAVVDMYSQLNPDGRTQAEKLIALLLLDETYKKDMTTSA